MFTEAMIKKIRTTAVAMNLGDEVAKSLLSAVVKATKLLGWWQGSARLWLAEKEWNCEAGRFRPSLPKESKKAKRILQEV